MNAGDDTVGCACRTPPYPIVLSPMPLAAVRALAEHVSGVYDSLSGVNGPRESEWLDAFVRDTRIEPPAEGAQNAAARMIERGALYLWAEDNAPLSMVGAGRETPTGCAVNCVYTPPNARRRGYATAAVAAVSNSLLAQGRKFCCLYTDAANPTSNSIYAKIGYEPIRDDSEIAFLP